MKVLHLSRLLLGLLILGLPGSGMVAGQDRSYLSGGELAAVGAASIGAYLGGCLAEDLRAGQGSLWPDPPAWEVNLSRWLGGEPRPGKRNFLDDFRGSALTPGVAGGLALASDLAYPVGEKWRGFGQTAFLFGSGVLATKGVTDLVKGIVARPRPLTHLAPELAEADESHPPEFHRRSFFSGHTSVAFFSAAFLVGHSRDTMRRELSAADYRNWRWIPPVLGYGWATFVGLSRVQAHRHYLTDVAAGAIAGSLLGWLFHSMNDVAENSGEGPHESPPLMLGISWEF